jgi:DNA sulfur modification protein DndD
MIIKELQLVNFICYFDKDNKPIKLKFNNGVNLFRGMNGGGKSQLFNAFYWVLFGDMYVTGKGWQKGYPTEFIPDFLRYKKSEGETIDISVMLKIEAQSHLKNNRLNDYTFFRKIQFIKKEEIFLINKNQELEISYTDSSSQTEYIPYLENERVVSIILPERLRKYMWFQGETIDELINFNDPKTLKQAIETLSYYPIYRQLSKISKLVNESIQEKINESIRQNRNLSNKEQSKLKEIEEAQKNLSICRDNIAETKKRYDEYKEKQFEIKKQLQTFAEYPQILKRIQDIDDIDNQLKNAGIQIEQYVKSDIINLWMLNGTHDLIKKSENVLNKVSKNIKEKSKSKNPLPLKVPGSIYISQMLEDEKCYICERDAKKGSKEYHAIESRLNESDKNELEYKEAVRKHTFLENSFVELANKPNELLKEVKQIPSEIKKYRNELTELFQKRRANKQRASKVYEDMNITEDDVDKIKSGSSEAKKLTDSLVFYNDKIIELTNKITALKENENGWLQKLINYKREREAFRKKSEKRSEFELAEPYAELLYNMTEDLKENAYEKLMTEIEKEANNLYSDYLQSNTSSKGSIKVDRASSQVIIEDDRGLPMIVSQGLQTAAKMSVINAILSLSTKKIGKSYPLIADAPSSVFSSENTQSYTKKIGETFKQVIIMSKDYSDEDLLKLKNEEHISKIWQLENSKIDSSLNSNSRSNYKTYIKEYK